MPRSHSPVIAFTLVIFLSLCSLSVGAVPVSFGALSSNNDGSTDVIFDSLNNRNWLRWDQLADLTYAQTLAAIGAGGSHEGYNIATLEDANRFVEALFGDPNACINFDTSTTFCGLSNPNVWHALFGNNGFQTSEFAWFLSDNGLNREAGCLQAFHTANDDGFYKVNECASVAETDGFAAGGSDSAFAIPWLLWESASVVPEPTSLALSGIGLAMFSKRRRKVL